MEKTACKYICIIIHERDKSSNLCHATSDKISTVHDGNSLSLYGGSIPKGLNRRVSVVSSSAFPSLANFPFIREIENEEVKGQSALNGMLHASIHGYRQMRGMLIRARHCIIMHGDTPISADVALSWCFHRRRMSVRNVRRLEASVRRNDGDINLRSKRPERPSEDLA